MREPSGVVQISLPNFHGEACELEGSMTAPFSGRASLRLRSPRALRLWIDGALVVDEPLSWRRYERELRMELTLPLAEGIHSLRVQGGGRPGWPEFVEKHCPSRNREHVRAELLRRHPDKLEISCVVGPSVAAPSASFRFLPDQFVESGVVWQHVLVKPLPGFNELPPSNDCEISRVSWRISVRSALPPFEARDISSEQERAAGFRRFAAPVGGPLDPIPETRKNGEEERVEPECEIVKFARLEICGSLETQEPDAVCATELAEEAKGRRSAEVELPVFEERGRLAPRRERREIRWPSVEELFAKIPKPLLPPGKELWRKLHEHSWDMFVSKLNRKASPFSGLPNDYPGTAAEGFLNDIFVWDSAFSAMSCAWGWRAFPVDASIDCLLSRQFDGGYIHREINVHSGLPDSFEPDFSPNPPLLALAEWKKCQLSGNSNRLAEVYPALAASHRWLFRNRRLADGTFWTTGLANGLDNSPSFGEGYPDLTAQMVHDAEILSLMAKALKRDAEAADWEAERQATAAAMNERLWSKELGFFCTSLKDGGFNPNKIATGFWPLWTGLVPKEKVEKLAEHLLDPKSFWRFHPIPSLAADSPSFIPGGNYWLGSTWAPTNAAAIWGFARSGREDLARKILSRHLDVMGEVFERTGRIWENYCCEKAERGSWSGPDYSWTSLGPIALLFEIALGLRPDALSNRLVWSLPEEPGWGVENLAFDGATISLKLLEGGKIEVKSDRAFELLLSRGGKESSVQVPPGVWLLAAP